MEVTRRKAPRLGDLFAGFMMKSKVALTSEALRGAPIVEADTAAKMEDVGKRIGSRPGFGEVAVKIHLIVSLEQAAEEEPVDALGLGIGGEARIEVGWARLDQEGQRRRIALGCVKAAGRSAKAKASLASPAMPNCEEGRTSMPGRATESCARINGLWAPPPETMSW